MEKKNKLKEQRIRGNRYVAYATSGFRMKGQRPDCGLPFSIGRSWCTSVAHGTFPRIDHFPRR